MTITETTNLTQGQLAGSACVDCNDEAPVMFPADEAAELFRCPPCHLTFTTARFDALIDYVIADTEVPGLMIRTREISRAHPATDEELRPAHQASFNLIANVIRHLRVELGRLVGQVEYEAGELGLPGPAADQAGPVDTLTVRQLVVVDEAGAERIRLGVHEDGTAEVFVNGGSQSSVLLGATCGDNGEGGAFISVMDGGNSAQWIDAGGVKDCRS